MSDHLCVDCKKDERLKYSPARKIVDGEITPRCATHLREAKLRRKKNQRAASVERTYGLSDEDNHALFLLQGGKCWLCQKATGATKRLAVDHDHATGEVRGRLCGPCNQFIGKLGDSVERAKRLAGYLSGDTPYRRLRAAQALTEALSQYDGGPGTIAVHSILEHAQELYANWQWNDDGAWRRTRVRTTDGVWQVTI